MSNGIFPIQTLNAISPVGLQRLDRDVFDYGTDIANPRGILVRSADLHSMELPESLYAVARAGAGTNNIPVEALAAIRAARPIAHVWYAEDALRWHLDRHGATPEQRRTTLARVARWREENPLDVVSIIRGIRASEGH